MPRVEIPCPSSRGCPTFLAEGGHVAVAAGEQVDGEVPGEAVPARS